MFADYMLMVESDSKDGQAFLKQAPAPASAAPGKGRTLTRLCIASSTQHDGGMPKRQESRHNMDPRSLEMVLLPSDIIRARLLYII